MSFRVDAGDALRGLTQARTVTIACVEAYGRGAAAEMEQYAKTHRPWTDRTGNARRTMEGRLERSGALFSVGVVGHMPYSVFLELGFARRYAVLYPTVNVLAPQVLRGLADTLKGLK